MTSIEENGFAAYQSGRASLAEIERRLASFEKRLAKMQRRATLYLGWSLFILVLSGTLTLTSVLLLFGGALYSVMQ